MVYFSRFSKRDFAVGNGDTNGLTDLSQYTAFFTKLTDDISYYTYYNVTPDERLDTISYNLYGTVNYYWTIPLLNPEITNTYRDSLLSLGNLNKVTARKYPGKCIVIEDDSNYNNHLVNQKPHCTVFQVGEIVEYLGKDGTAKYRVRKKYANLNQVIVDEISDNGIYETDQSRERSTIAGVESGNVSKVAIIVDYAIATHHFIDADTGLQVPYFYDNKVPVSVADVERDLNETKSQIKVIRPEFISEIVDLFKEEMKGVRFGQ